MVGSVPLATTTEVFERLVSALPNRLSRIPDGEPGSRGNCKSQVLESRNSVPRCSQRSETCPMDVLLPPGHPNYPKEEIN